MRSRSLKGEIAKNKEIWINDMVDKLGIERKVALKIYRELKKENYGR